MSSNQLTIQQSYRRAELSLPPLWDRPSPGSFWFDKASSILLPAPGPANRATVLTFSVPVGKKAVIRYIANVALGGAFQDFSGQIIWRVFQNALAVPNYGNIAYSLGNLNFPAPTFIELDDSDILIFTVETTVVINASTACRVAGWWYPHG